MILSALSNTILMSFSSLMYWCSHSKSLKNDFKGDAMVVVVAITVYGDSDAPLDDAVVAVDKEHVDDTTEQDMVELVVAFGLTSLECFWVVFRCCCRKKKGLSVSVAAPNENVCPSCEMQASRHWLPYHGHKTGRNHDEFLFFDRTVSNRMWYFGCSMR